MTGNSYTQWLHEVSHDGRLLRFVPESMKTTELCRAACQQYPAAMRYVPETIQVEIKN